MMTGYESIYHSLAARLKHCDFMEICPRLGLCPSDGGAVVQFLGKTYWISKNGVNTTGAGCKININYRSVLAYYALSAGSGAPANIFVPLHKFTAMAAGPATTESWMNRPLAEKYKDNYEQFTVDAKALQFEYAGSQGAAGRIWQSSLLPRIPVQMVYYMPDEDFPAEIKILYDLRAGEFLAYEVLAFLNGCVVNSFLALT